MSFIIMMHGNEAFRISICLYPTASHNVVKEPRLIFLLHNNFDSTPVITIVCNNEVQPFL